MNRFLLPALIAGLGLIPAGRVTAQTFTTLHSFNGGSDGAQPYAGVITNLSGNTLYGTTYYRGSSGYGTVFAVNTDGTSFTVLHNFTGGTNGGQPTAGLILSGNTLYGTAYQGGSSYNGTVFKINTNGTGFTNLHSFTTTSHPGYSDGTNSDGAFPYAGLIANLSGNRLYGTAYQGGSSGAGTVFGVNTDGTGFTTLHSFTATPGFPYPPTNSDGTTPSAGLLLSGDTLYGTASHGGSAGNGTVFAVNTDGSGFTTLHSFTESSGSSGQHGTNSDGATPFAGLILSGNTLYGTTFYAGSSGYGTVFALNTNGTGFTTLHSFTPGSEGISPQDGLIISGNTLYGTTGGGGSSLNGTVFSLSFAPQLTINRSGTNVIMTWPTNVAGFDYTGFTLQSTTNLIPTAWSPVVQPAVTNAGQISVAVPTTAGRTFFRLKSQ